MVILQTGANHDKFECIDNKNNFRNRKNNSYSISGTRRTIATAFQEPEEQ
jgi:hypothetical protein